MIELFPVSPGYVYVHTSNLKGFDFTVVTQKQSSSESGSLFDISALFKWLSFISDNGPLIHDPCVNCRNRLCNMP